MRSSVVAVNIFLSVILIGATGAPVARRIDSLPLTKSWTQTVDGAAPLGAAASEKYLIAGWADHFDAFLIATGAKDWSLPIPATRVACEAAFCIVADDATVRSIDLARRAVVWQQALATPLNIAPTLRSGWVLLSSKSGAVRALQATDGREVWTHSAGSALAGAPSINGDQVAIATTAGNVSLLDLPSGRAIWTTTLDTTPGAPRLGGGRVLVGTSNGRLAVLDAADGRLRFKTRTGGNVTGAPTLDEKHFYTVSQDGVLRAFDRGNGAQRWYANLATRASAGPVVDGDLVFVALRNGAVDVRLNDGKGAVQLAAPGGDTNNVPIAPMIIGGGATLSVMTVSFDLSNTGKWSLVRYATATAITTAPRPARIPGLDLKLTAPR